MHIMLTTNFSYLISQASECMESIKIYIYIHNVCIYWFGSYQMMPNCESQRSIKVTTLLLIVKAFAQRIF